MAARVGRWVALAALVVLAAACSGGTTDSPATDGREVTDEVGAPAFGGDEATQEGAATEAARRPRTPRSRGDRPGQRRRAGAGARSRRRGDRRAHHQGGHGHDRRRGGHVRPGLPSADPARAGLGRPRRGVVEQHRRRRCVAGSVDGARARRCLRGPATGSATSGRSPTAGHVAGCHDAGARRPRVSAAYLRAQEAFYLDLLTEAQTVQDAIARCSSSSTGSRARSSRSPGSSTCWTTAPRSPR